MEKRYELIGMSCEVVRTIYNLSCLQHADINEAEVQFQPASVIVNNVQEHSFG